MPGSRIQNLTLILTLCIATSPARCARAIEPYQLSERRTIVGALLDSPFSDPFGFFYAGPAWLVNAMPGSRPTYVRSPFIYNVDGDRTESAQAYHPADVGTLASPFNVMLFNNVSMFVSSSGGAVSKRTGPLLVTDNTAYYYGGGTNWDGATTWGPLGGYPNAPGDSALNVQEVGTHVIQNHPGGVTVGVIDNVPTTPGNSGHDVSWTITTNQPIILDSGDVNVAAQINNSQAIGTSSLTIDTTTSNGLQLKSNLVITNANTSGAVTISAPISDFASSGSHSVTVAGAGTTILSGANTYSGTTLVSSGTLNAGGEHALGGTSAVTVNSGGTLVFSGSTTDRINDAATITLAGGVLNTAGLSEGAAGTPGMGALTLTSASTIDLGSVASILAFADSSGSAWTGALRILNWTGNSTGGGTDQVYFGTDANGLTGTQLNQISFYSDGGTTLLGTATILSDGEIVPLQAVPEPTTWIGAALAALAVVLTRPRRAVRKDA